MKFNFPELTDMQAEMIHSAVHTAEESIRVEGGICPMAILLEDRTGEMHMVNLDGATKEQTGALINGARTLASVIFMAEAWFRTIKAEPGSALAEAIKNDPKSVVMPAPHQCPDRREGVMVQFFHQKRHIMLSAELTRPTDGGHPSLSEWRLTDNHDPDTVLRGASFSPPGARLTSGGSDSIPPDTRN